MPADTTRPQPTIIEHLATAVYPSFAMLTGMQLDVFTPLKDGPLTAGQLADALSVQAEKLSPLLYALVTADLLTVDSDRFANTPEAQHFLVKGQPTYLGGRHENFSEVWTTLLSTAETIRTGAPQCKKDFATLSPEAQLPFFRGLHPGTVASGRALASQYDFAAYQTLAGCGGWLWWHGAGTDRVLSASACHRAGLARGHSHHTTVHRRGRRHRPRPGPGGRCRAYPRTGHV